MGKRDGKSESSGPGAEDFVPVVVARNSDQAERFRNLLEDHDIPVRVGTDGGPEELAAPPAVDSSEELSRGIPVLVPENVLDEAGEVIAEREGFEDFGDEDADDTDDDDEDFSLDDDLPAGWSEHREDDDCVEDDDDGDDGDDPLSEGP